MADPVQQPKRAPGKPDRVTEEEFSRQVQAAYKDAYARRKAELQTELTETVGRVESKLQALEQRLDPRKPTDKPGPHSQIALHRNQNGSFYEEKQYFRLNEKGELQVWAASGKRTPDGKPEYTWQDSTSPTSQPAARQFTCLYVSNGKIYDASGREVKSLVTGGNASVNSEHIINKIDLQGEGKVCGLKTGQLNALTLNGKRVVFTEGPPPHSQSEADAAADLPPRPDTYAPASSTNVERACLSHPEIRDTSGTYDCNSSQPVLPRRPRFFNFGRYR